MNKPKIYKGKIGIYLVLLIMVATIMFLLKMCSSEINVSQNKYIKAGGDTINVAIEISPLSLSMESDSLGGFYYELLNLISKKHNVTFKFHEFVPLSFALSQLETNMFDIVVADIPATAELKSKFLFTEPLYIDQQVLVQRKDVKTGRGNITNHHQLASDTVWVVAGSPFVDRIYNLADELGCDTINVIQDKEYSSEQLIILTALGEIKQSVVNKNIANAMIEDYPQLDINTQISFNQFQVWLLNINNHSLCKRVNEWIIEVKKTPEYLNLYSKYIDTKK